MAAKAPTRGKNDLPAPIIVKKITIVAAGHHGGAWKVAYADFVTAMMAFFLLLWLLGATTEKQRKGIADYFTPTLVKMRQESAGANGLLHGSSIVDADNYPHRAGQTGTKALTIPRDTVGGPKDGAGKLQRMNHIKDVLAQKLAKTEATRRLARQVKMVDTSEGIRIDLVDDAQFAMFQLGTTVLTLQARDLVKALSETLGPEGSALTVRGHTDSLPWRAGIVSNNWSLSAGRAEATRQALMLGGVPQDRFKRIEGVADREPLIQGSPQDPRNRRISVTLAN